MGGGVGLGNRSAVAGKFDCLVPFCYLQFTEYNIMCDRKPPRYVSFKTLTSQ